MARSRTTLPFAHKPNPDGSIDSICPNCFRAVGSSTVESELSVLEKAHTCIGFELERVLYPTVVPVVKPVFNGSPSGSTIDLQGKDKK